MQKTNQKITKICQYCQGALVFSIPKDLSARIAVHCRHCLRTNTIRVIQGQVDDQGSHHNNFIKEGLDYKSEKSFIGTKDLCAAVPERSSNNIIDSDQEKDVFYSKNKNQVDSGPLEVTQKSAISGILCYTCSNCNNLRRVRLAPGQAKAIRITCSLCQTKNSFFFDSKGGQWQPFKVDNPGDISQQRKGSQKEKEKEKEKEPDQLPITIEHAASINLVANNAIPPSINPRPGSNIGSIYHSKQKLPGILRRPKVSHRRFRPVWVFLLALPITALIGLYAFLGIMDHFPQLFLAQHPKQYLAAMENVLPNRIYDRHGALMAELFSKKTSNLSYQQIPNSFKEKLLFVEDRSFYEHRGVNLTAILRAALRNISQMDYVQGASTLSQQLSRMLLEDFEKSLARKLRETVFAFFLENNLDKGQILAGYCNHVYLGHGAYGFNEAAKFYFGKSLDQLNFVQELILVSLPAAPNNLSPILYPKRLEDRMDSIYLAMAEQELSVPTIWDYSQQKRAAFALTAQKSPSSSVFGERKNDCPYISELIRLQIGKILGAKYQYNANLRIDTTIDANLQITAQDQVKKYLENVAPFFYPVLQKTNNYEQKLSQQRIAEFVADNQLLFNFSGIHLENNVLPILQAAVAAIKPQSGEILFLIGGREFSSQNQFNRATQMVRQTGSSIKPILFAAAISQKLMTAATLLDDKPIYVHYRNQEDWIPEDYHGVYEGRVTARNALTHSKNLPAIQVARILGGEGLAAAFRNFFFYDEQQFDKRYQADESIALGSIAMSPLEMATAYGAFANNGVIQNPYLIQKISDDQGNVLYAVDAEGKVIINAPSKTIMTKAKTNQILENVKENQMIGDLNPTEGGFNESNHFLLARPTSVKAIRSDAAAIMQSIMSRSVWYSNVAKGGFRHSQLIGKTGTSNDFKDSWFVGVLPDLSAAVWVGYDDQHYAMNRGCGACVAGPLFGKIMSEGKYKTTAKYTFHPQPKRYRICSKTGTKPCRGCDTAWEYFISGTQPEMQCSDILPSNHPSNEKNLDQQLNAFRDFE